MLLKEVIQKALQAAEAAVSRNFPVTLRWIMTSPIRRAQSWIPGMRNIQVLLPLLPFPQEPE